LIDTLFSALLASSADIDDANEAVALQLPMERQASLTRLLGIIACCWLGYVAILFLLDTLLLARSPQLQLLPLFYYLFHACVAASVLGLAAAPKEQRRLGRAFLPIVIICLTVLPLLITALLPPLPTPDLFCYRQWKLTVTTVIGVLQCLGEHQFFDISVESL
jgi:hypothetical protein